MNKSEAGFFDQLLHTLDRIDPWLARIDPDSPRSGVGAGSPLAADDRKTDPFQTSFAAWHSISHSVDCLHMLRSTLRDARVLHMYAPYSLIRGAMENSSTAVWLLAPPGRPERILRRLRLAALDIDGGEKIRTLLGSTGPRTVEQRRDQVRNLARQANVDPQQALRKPTYSEIVEAAGGHTPVGETVARLIWSMCSAVAHGDFWSTVSIADHVELPGAPAGIAHLRVTANVERLFFATYFAAEMAAQAWRFYDERSRSPY